MAKKFHEARSSAFPNNNRLSSTLLLMFLSILTSGGRCPSAFRCGAFSVVRRTTHYGRGWSSNTRRKTTTTPTATALFDATTEQNDGSEILSESTASSSASSFTPSPTTSKYDITPEAESEAANDVDLTSIVSSSSSDELELDDVECYVGEGQSCLPMHLVTLPQHSNENVNAILEAAQTQLRKMHTTHSRRVELSNLQRAKEAGRVHEQVYANTYVDLGKIDTIGFDFDYTLVTYTEELLELIYEKALDRLVTDKQYPIEMSQAGLSYDPFFSIRGLAVDKETGWITHLSYTHKVAVAWEGREKLPSSRIFEEYRGKRALRPNDRRMRLKPLNDLFSMAECCLIADTIQFFKDRDIPYCARNVVDDVLNTVTSTHLSGDFHRLVAKNPERYFDPTPHLKDVLSNLKESGKRLIFVSNSPFWYVDNGMRYVFGGNWRQEWDAIITSAGKPNFYTDESRPFRELCQETRRLKFKRVEKLEQGKVYTEGCLKELVRLMDWSPRPRIYTPNGAVNGSDEESSSNADAFKMRSGTHEVATPHALYIGDSLFADLVDAKREFGWTTAAVTPEVGYETEIQSQTGFALALKSIDVLLNSLRSVQEELGTSLRTEEDIKVLDKLESLVSLWRDRETELLGNPFGSVFRARYQPSLFAHSLKRYCDLYMTSVSSLRHYSPQHRFYPEQNHRLLAHEISALKLGKQPLLDD